MNSLAGTRPLPGSKALVKRYEQFSTDVPSMLKSFKLHESDIAFADWPCLVRDWLEKSGA